MNDDEPQAAPDGDWTAPLAMAIRFYSRLPAGRQKGAPELTRMAPLLPFAGLAIGIAPAAVLAIGVLTGVPALFAAALALAVWVAITGAMAEDGFADALDGLFGGPSPARRLDIMRDARHGTYAVTGLVLALLLRASALAALAFINPLAGALGWLGLTVAARSLALWLPASMVPARAEGVAVAAGTIEMRSFGIGAVLAAVILLICATPLAGLTAAGVALVVMGLAVLGWRALCQTLVGGYSGDLIGAGQLILEIAGLSIFMLWVG